MKRLDDLMAKWRGIALLVLGRTVAARAVFDGMLQMRACCRKCEARWLIEW